MRINKDKFLTWLADRRGKATVNEKIFAKRGEYGEALRHSVEREIYAELITLIRFPDPEKIDWIERENDEDK